MSKALGKALGFAAVMAVIYFVTPIAYPPADLTLTQAAAITLLAFVGRAVLAEGVTVKVEAMAMTVITDEEEDE